jgi:hypothetical protein
VVLSAVMATDIMTRTIAVTPTPVCVVGARLGRRGSPTTVAYVATTRPSAATRRKKKHFLHWQMNIQHYCDDD